MCHYKKIPIKLHPHYSEMGIDTIILMPVVDRRVDKSGNINLENDIRIPAGKILEKKGYRVVLPDKFSQEIDINTDAVAEMDIEDLSMLGPKDSRALMFIYVEDVLDSYAVIAYAFKIEATGSLIEKHEKIELWRDKGIGASGQGGLMSAAFAGMDKGEALRQCLNSILISLPANPEAQAKKKSKSRKTRTTAESKPVAEVLPKAETPGAVSTVPSTM